MYVSVDRDNMKFMHKHAVHNVVTGLVWIEGCNVSGHITPIDYPWFLHGFTDLELQLLYRNTTGLDTPHRGEALRALVHELAERLPETDAVLAEVDAQCAKIPDGSKEAYRYVRGAMAPALPGELWEVATLRCPQALDVASVAASAPVRFAKPATPAAVPSAAAAPRAPRQAGPRSAPGAGSVTDRIFKLCDEVRAALPPGTPLAEVRKAAIPKLEEAGVNGNSARKGSSMWIQSRQ